MEGLVHPVFILRRAKQQLIKKISLGRIMTKKQKTAWDSFCDGVCVLLLLAASIGFVIFVGVNLALDEHEDSQSNPKIYLEKDYDEA